MIRPILFTLAAFTSIAAATPGIAAQPDPTDGKSSTTAAAPSEAPKQIRYCIVETPTGSHISRKTCRSREEWLKLGFDPLAK